MHKNNYCKLFLQIIFAFNYKKILIMTQIGSNIKKLRTVKGLSQQAFADLFKLTRGNISSYEEFRAEPKISVILNMAKYFGIPVSSLLEKKLTVNEILNFEDYFKNGTEQIEIKDLIQIPFLSKTYLQENPQIKDINELPHFYLPNLYNSQLLAIENNSLIPNPKNFRFEESSILFFDKIKLETLHTLSDNIGYYMDENEMFFGRYTVEGKDIRLVLNDWKEKLFDIDDIDNFWKLHSKYERI